MLLLKISLFFSGVTASLLKIRVWNQHFWGVDFALHLYACKLNLCRCNCLFNNFFRKIYTWFFVVNCLEASKRVNIFTPFEVFSYTFIGVHFCYTDWGVMIYTRIFNSDGNTIVVTQAISHLIHNELHETGNRNTTPRQTVQQWAKFELYTKT